MDRTSCTTDTDGYVFSHGPLELTIDGQYGKIRSLSRDQHRIAFDTDATQITWTVGGDEQRNPPNDKTTFVDASIVGAGRELDSVEVERSAHSTHMCAQSRTGEWHLEETYGFDREVERIRKAFTLTNHSDSKARLRRVVYRIPLHLENISEWSIDLPGAAIPPDRPLDEFDDGEIIAVGPNALLGLVGVEHQTSGHGVGIWAHSEEHPVSLGVHRAGEQLELEYGLEAAAVLEPGESLSFGNIWIEPFSTGWEAVLDQFGEWWTQVGVTVPAEIPAWTKNAAYYEVYIGHTVKDDTGYGPYPTVNALIDDLPRIRDLGYTVLQVMPSQPTPSYLYPAQPWGLDAWGQSADIRRLVDAAHAVGLRVIFDVVLHGVLDEETLDNTVESIHENNLLDGPNAWLAEYVLDHAPEWRKQIPAIHPLATAHPEWFVWDDTGAIAQRYTKAFDLALPAVHEYVIDTLKTIITEFDADGFRIDAPTWNNMSNWRTDLAYPASYPRVGSIELLRRARREVKSMRPDALFYIEAGSPHFRQSSEVNYPNDETWLPAALFGDATTAYGQPFVSSPLTARGIEAWLKRCEQIVPPGSQGRTVHHLSSHDTVWWSPPGRKWCIERYGRDGTIAMTAILTLIDGSYMTFAGDEREIEPAIKQLLTLRKELPELRKGDCSFDVITSSDEKVFTALRSHEGDQSIIAVNLADEPTEATVSLPASVVQGEENVHMYDALRREWYRQENSNVNEGSIDSITLSFEPFEPRLIVLRETTE